MASKSDVSSSHRESRSREKSGRRPSHSDRSSGHSDRSVSHNDRSSSHRDRSSSHRDHSSSHRERSVSHRDRSSRDRSRSKSRSHHSRRKSGSHHSRSKSGSHHSKSDKKKRKYTSEERVMKSKAKEQLRQEKAVRKENRRQQRKARDDRLDARREARSITREEHNKRKAETQAKNEIILREKEDRQRYKFERDNLESSYKNEFQNFLRLRKNFDELLEKQFNKNIPFGIEGGLYNYNHIEDFKHLLLEKGFRIDVEVDEVHSRQVTIFRPHIKEIIPKKKKRFSVISKKKEETAELSTMYNSELGDLCDAFEAMYTGVNRATHDWWSYKQFAHAPVKPVLEEQPRANRREIWVRFTKNQYDAEKRKTRKEARNARRERNMIRRQRKLDAGLPVKEKRSKKKPDQTLEFKQEIQEPVDYVDSPMDDSNIYENYDDSDAEVYSYYSD